jgi:outer membrane protein OmpA-like peptidoglycan-associated protein
LCKECTKCKVDSAGISAVGSTGSQLGVWNVNDGTDYSGSSSNYYRFIKSNSNTITPLGTDLDKLNTSLTDYLKSKGQRGLNVIGYYKSDETNDNTFYENLGLARANNIKQLLVNLGIPGKQITTSSELITDGTYNGDTLMRGGNYSFFAIEDNTSKLGELKTALQGKPIVLYFKVNSNELELSAEQQKQFGDLIYYLDNVVDARVEVSGHTDSDGGKAANIALSKGRADFVKNYLNTKGNIAADRMDVTGYGPDKPIASNSTTEGKAQNRRVEVVLK